MTNQFKQAVCQCCSHEAGKRKYVRAEKQKANHILHLLLTLVTGGLWAFVWLEASFRGKYRCPTCGSSDLRVVSGFSKEWERAS